VLLPIKVKDEQMLISYATLCFLKDYRLLTMASSEFNELVNMSASELEEWLKEEQFTSSGWAKDDGSGETIGY
jgi:Protein of unknown function (DUF3140)